MSGKTSNDVKITKKSIGVIIFNRGLDKVLLVQKKCTYAYSEFVLGKYDKNNQHSLVEKFNRMSIQEKMIISSLEFEFIWYYMFMSKDKSDAYCRAFGKFYKNFLTNSRNLKKILSNSHKNSSLLWEPPKGRKNKMESTLACAIRETEEETRICHKSYQLIPGKKVKKQFVSNGVRYVIIYYVAILTEPERVWYDITNVSQATEVSDIQWVSVNKLSQYYILNDIRQIIKSLVKEIKKERTGKKATIEG